MPDVCFLSSGGGIRLIMYWAGSDILLECNSRNQGIILHPCRFQELILIKRERKRDPEINTFPKKWMAEPWGLRIK